MSLFTDASRVTAIGASRSLSVCIWNGSSCPIRDLAGGLGAGRVGWLPVLGTRGFQRPLSDPSTDLQVRCHGPERDGRDVPQADLTRFRYRPLGQLLTIGGSSRVYGCYRSICRRIQDQQIVRKGENRPRKQQQYDG